MSNESSDNQIVNRPAHLFKPGQSGNLKGRPSGIRTLKEIAAGYTMGEKEAFIRHVYDSAMAGDGNVNAKWASMFVDITGEGGTFKVQAEVSGPWSAVMEAIVAKVEGERIVDAESVRLLDVPDTDTHA